MRLSLIADNVHPNQQGASNLHRVLADHSSYLWAGDGVVVRHEADNITDGDTTISFASAVEEHWISWRVWHSEIGPAWDSGRMLGWYLGDEEILIQEIK